MCTAAQKEIARLYSANLLNLLLADKTSGRNIIWATHAYSRLGSAYSYGEQIYPNLLLAFHLKNGAKERRLNQAERAKSHAEVFTPFWIVQKMNNHIEDIWFASQDAFNAPRVQFPKGKSWQNFVDSRRMEITCGQAPYLTTRCDVCTGKFIPLRERVGMLDRKLRVVSENALDEDSWLAWAYRACQSVYGYDIQGYSVLLARLNMLLTFKDNMLSALGREPNAKECRTVLSIAAWNIWQMDGTTGQIPYLSAKNGQLLLFSRPGEPNPPSCLLFNWRRKRTALYNALSPKAFKFDFIVGNPPYQKESHGEGRNYSSPIYHTFIESCYRICTRVLLIHPARFLFGAGSTPKEWNEKMLLDEHLKVLWYKEDGKLVFPNISAPIKGGIAITYRDAHITFGAIQRFSKFPQVNAILRKVTANPSFQSLMAIIYPRTAYRLTAKMHQDNPQALAKLSPGHTYDLASNIWQRIPEVFFNNNPSDGHEYIKILGRSGNKRGYKYIRRAYVRSHENLDSYKVFLPQASGTGSFGEEVGEPSIEGPGTAATETFIGMGNFNTKKEASALAAYVNTKFARTLLSILKVTQNGNKQVWKYVPLQDFSPKSNIDWAKPIAEIDRQLYAKYGLSDDEVAFIESHAAPMRKGKYVQLSLFTHAMPKRRTSAQEEIARLYSINALTPLLADRTSGKNIIWATHAYTHLGGEYGKTGQITPSLLLTPPFRLESRAEKERQAQSERTKSHAEVFTPLWVVQKMNNYIEDIWFSAPGAFNAPRVQFPKGKSWQSFVDSKRMEITCGEAPYLTTRCDVSTGKFIPIQQRVGILDRKLRVVSENASSEQDWLAWAYRACQSVYGYDFQGDNVLISRLNIFLTFKDYMLTALGREPTAEECLKLLTIASWNIWQMDGITGNIPFCKTEQLSLFAESSAPPPCRVFNWIKKQAIPYNRLKESSMKFDFIIGNPPYQEEITGTSDKPVYNYFMDASYAVSDKVMLITPARFLFNAGKTPKDWNEKMLADPHLKVVQYEQNSSQVFENTDIKGGIAITYRDTTKIYGAIEVFSSFEEMRTLTAKIYPYINNRNLTSIIYLQNKFNLKQLYKDYPQLQNIISSNGKERRIVSSSFEKLSVFHAEKTNDTEIKIIGIVNNNKRGYRYIDKCYIEDNGNLNVWKVLLPKSNGSGAIGEVLSTPLVGEPLVGYTQSFIGIGAFETQNEANACLKYVKSKFARTMLGILKITQDNPPEKWKYVPLQDFTPSSDIDWTKSIAEIDAQLYKKYGLDDAEVAFIESHVKEMK